MSRSYDWTPLGLNSDPVPGEPSVLTAQVKKYRDIASNIQNGATSLSAIVNDYASQSDFIEEFAFQAEEVIGRIKKAKTKYSGFADAVESYIGPLSTARQDSYNLLMAARSASDDLATAEYWRRHYQTEYWEAEEGDRPAIQKDIDRYEDDAADARALITSNSDELWAILSRCQAAAEAAASAIEETGDASGINDSAWVQFWEEYGGWIDGALTVLAVVAAIVLVVALCIPGVNVAVIALIGAISLGIAIATALNAWLQVSAGTKSITDAIIETALALIPFGIGKIIKPAAAVVQAAMRAGKPAMIASSQALHISGVTGPVAAARIAELVAKATPAQWLKPLLGSADELAQIQAIRGITRGPSTLINAALDGQMWKLALDGSPLADAVLGATGISDKVQDVLQDGANNAVEFIEQFDFLNVVENNPSPTQPFAW